MYKDLDIDLKCAFIILFFIFEAVRSNDVNKTNIREILNTENWTSCEEFLTNTTFDRNKVINTDWQIFYFWSTEQEETYHLRFSVPSRILIDQFRVELDKELQPPVNWTEAELFMETTIDLSALYIRTGTPGMFRLMPSLAFKATSVPMLLFGLKYVEPGYLGIMNCKYRLSYALAPVGKMPKPEELKLAAESIGLRTDIGYSYLVKPDPRPSPAPFSLDDADDDEEMDIDEHEFIGNSVNFDEHRKIDEDDY